MLNGSGGVPRMAQLDRRNSFRRGNMNANQDNGDLLMVLNINFGVSPRMTRPEVKKMLTIM